MIPYPLYISFLDKKVMPDASHLLMKHFYCLKTAQMFPLTLLKVCASLSAPRKIKHQPKSKNLLQIDNISKVQGVRLLNLQIVTVMMGLHCLGLPA